MVGWEVLAPGFLQRLSRPGLGFKFFNMARRTIKGYEAMNTIRKGDTQAN